MEINVERDLAKIWQRRAGKDGFELGLIDPRYMPETDTARLQLLAQIMELEPDLTLKLIVLNFPPNSFSHQDIQIDLVEGSALTRTQLVFVNLFA